ncbi:MAG: hypothetical protein HND58_17570 [Planctomycetota bacterium]|nr:MAG: hypothetical protein HND58_17570 [Planctomycetota bacterium]
MTRDGVRKLRLGVVGVVAGGLLMAAVAGLAGCSPGKKIQVERPRVEARAVPAPLRGTVGSLAQSTAGEPIVISGFGLVVGLNGTGGGLLDERIAATMEREMLLQGVGLAANVEGTAAGGPDPAASEDGQRAAPRPERGGGAGAGGHPARGRRWGISLMSTCRR